MPSQPILVVALVVSTTVSLTPINSRHTTSSLSAMPSGSQPWGSRSVPSKTARESAFNVEWEPMTELERRIEDGIHYEHIVNTHVSQDGLPRSKRLQEDDDNDIPRHRGVFAGYRFSEEEYNRLKSADA